MVTEITLRLDLPHRSQAEVIEQARRFNVVACGRRWGKTTLGENRGAVGLLRGKRVGWFGPTYKNLAEVWERFVEVLDPITRDKSEQEKRIETITRGVLDCWSLDSYNVARGRGYDLVLIDEAAYVAALEQAWNNVIRPTLTDTRGEAWFYGSPNGLNYFWTLHQRGGDPTQTDWASWQRPTSENPYIAAEELADARRDLPQRVFAQEYLAEFLEDGAGVFRRVLQACTSTPLDRGLQGHRYVAGVDWGKVNDFTVVSVWDAHEGRQVALERTNRVDYELQLGTLLRVREAFRPALWVVEANSMGAPLVERLQRLGFPLVAWTATHATKLAVIDAYALAFEQGHVRLLNDRAPNAQVQRAEHLAYQAERLPSGLLRYGAPEGQHDDCVIAGALAWAGLAAPVPAPTKMRLGGGGG